MKKLFTLCFFLLTTGFMMAEDNATFLFIDKDGNVISDGATVTRNVLIEDDLLGNFINSDINVKNVSAETVSVRIVCQIESLDNGDFQLCFPVNCIRKSVIETFITGSDKMTPSESRDLKCEWFPMDYGICKATLTIEELNSFGGKIADGPSVTIVFNYQDPSGIQSVKTIATSAEHYNLAGQYIKAGLRGIHVVRMENGSIRKIIKR